jgi:hypothetical protein
MRGDERRRGLPIAFRRLSSPFVAFHPPHQVLLYRAGEGYPDFDPARAKRYFDGTVERIVQLVRDVVAKWERAGI